MTDILRRYGATYQSVDLDFDSKALNEIGFRRNHRTSIAVDELSTRYEVVETFDLTAEANGDVQDATEQELLNRLEARLREVLESVPDGGVLVVENEMGHDYPKTRQKISNVTTGIDNTLHFEYTVAPPLRVSTYRPKG